MGGYRKSDKIVELLLVCPSRKQVGSGILFGLLQVCQNVSSDAYKKVGFSQ